jgi:uncharacterized integral membrane protein
MSIEQDHGELERRRRGSPVRTARIVLGIVLLGAAIAVIADNRQDTSVGYVVGDIRAPLIVVLLIAGVVGALIGWLLLHRVRNR